ncbi:UNVERIFIED_CONTAM: hypothetical protein K2H54_055639 [Gekko kuhli]
MAEAARGQLEPAPAPDAEETLQLGKGGNEDGQAADEGREEATAEPLAPSPTPREDLQNDGEVGSPETTPGSRHGEAGESTESETEKPPVASPEPDGGPRPMTPDGDAGSPEVTPNAEGEDEGWGSPAAAREEPDEPGTAAGQNVDGASGEGSAEAEFEGRGAPEQPDGEEEEAGNGGSPPEAVETSEGARAEQEPAAEAETAGRGEEPGEESAVAAGWQRESAEIAPGGGEEPLRAESPSSPAGPGEVAGEEASAADGREARGEGERAAEEAGVEGSAAEAELDGEPTSPGAAEPSTEGERGKPLEEPAEGEAERARGVNGTQGGEAEEAAPGGLLSLAAPGGEKQEHDISLFVKPI